MKFYSYVHDKEGLTKPVFIREHNCKTEVDAFEQAMKDPGVKAIVGKQQTGRLYVKVHYERISHGAS